MSWTPNNTNFLEQGASNTTIAQSVTGVNVNDTVVLLAVNDSTQTVSSISDGTTTFTNLTATATGALGVQFAWLPASAVNGTVTYTVTYSATAAGRGLYIAVVTPTALPILDLEGTGGTGISNTPLSGSITTTGSDEIIFGGHGHENSLTSSVELIAGASADVVVRGNIGALWFKVTTLSSQGATATLSGSDRWGCNLASFKITGGGGGGTTITGLGRRMQSVIYTQG